MLFLSCVFMLLHPFIADLWSPAGKGLSSWLMCVMFIVILSGVILDCIQP